MLFRFAEDVEFHNSVMGLMDGFDGVKFSSGLKSAFFGYCII